MREILAAAKVSTKPVAFINGVISGVFATGIDIDMEHDGSVGDDFVFNARFNDMNGFGDLYLDCVVTYKGEVYDVLVEISADSEWNKMSVAAVGKLPPDLVEFLTNVCEPVFSWTVDPFDCRENIIKLF